MRLAFFRPVVSFLVMNRMKSLVVGLVLLGGVAACGIFEDPSPENISILMTGSDGTEVMAIYSQVFTAGINQETSTTEVEITESDTVFDVLPLDTIIDIEESRQLFLQVETMPTDTAQVQVRVDVDGRNVLAREGAIFPGTPWRYVYQFNRPLTDVVEVVF